MAIPEDQRFRKEEMLAYLGGARELPTGAPYNREEEWIMWLRDAIGGGGGGTSDYSDLSNKPSINGVTLVGNKTTGDLGITSTPMTETTWAALKALRDGGNLVPGMQYRITDYETVITGSYDLSALGAQGYLHTAGVPESHPFDVIVTADDESHLNENARAALHEGDTYFANSAIGAWKLKYCLDNDQQTYAWANANGKGVIFWMEDEFNNRVGYDFKNIRFLRYALKVADAQGDYTPPADGKLAYDASTQPNRYGGVYQIFTALQAYMSAGSYVNPYLHQYKGVDSAVADYDFAVGANILGTIQFSEPNAQYLSTFGADWYYTFDYYDAGESAHVDASLNTLAKVPCRENYIELETEPIVALMQGTYNVFGLGGSVWETNSVYTAGLSSGSWNNISGNKLGMHTWTNTFGNDCYSNTFGDVCYSNTFGDNMLYLHCGDHVQSVQADTAQYGSIARTVRTLENYDGTSGHATLITKTGYGQETAISTTDGGATWA